ncbi:MBL fold metallo-hydrolase [Variovorax saccharolyticus]|uniref:MBL fold metallo-hydrolase n=1 Tax=Variovorax saccharolyticus TaxID=3053516 RepID=UPI002577AE0A|nr:MBL fold metallo-hydrolase [Variovorax sp. J31P216]MDM0026304.1 MBL fold metallo-hydrolase [Variovorax sp. J31P216]
MTMATKAIKAAAPPAKTTAGKTAAARKKKPAGKTTAADRGGLRVRMYRVGFGDFFLMTVPTRHGPRHILIDCGVHAGNIKSMPACVKDLVEVTGRKLALVIVTHYHADHLSGFATQAGEFEQFEVEAVWITNRLDPKNGGAVKIKTQIHALATHLRLQLAARQDLDGAQALAMAENALGVAGGSNDRAMALVTSGFRNKPPVHYYEAGDTAELPPSLRGALTAQILGPAPKDAAADFTASDNKAEQYLAAVEDQGLPSAEGFEPFDRRWPATAADYPPEAFRPWATPAEMEKALHAVQPDVLAAAAKAIDGALNNQSLVVLFTCQRRKLLFVGDAQWGNWAYWLYGKPVKGADPGISAEARKILASIDFYKVGHHGSTNATPIPAVGALSMRCVAMCSTETGFPSAKRTYGSIEKQTEVPRIPLMEALEKQTGKKLVRSDWLATTFAKASPEARSQLDRLPPDFETGDIFIEYVFRD